MTRPPGPSLSLTGPPRGQKALPALPARPLAAPISPAPHTSSGTFSTGSSTMLTHASLERGRGASSQGFLLSGGFGWRRCSAGAAFSSLQSIAAAGAGGHARAWRRCVQPDLFCFCFCLWKTTFEHSKVIPRFPYPHSPVRAPTLVSSCHIADALAFCERLEPQRRH